MICIARREYHCERRRQTYFESLFGSG